MSTGNLKLMNTEKLNCCCRCHLGSDDMTVHYNLFWWHVC